MSCGCEGQDNCTEELSSLPLLAGCPADDEYFLVGNAAGGRGAGKYARRRYADIKTCIASGSIEFSELQFTVGDVNAPMTAGDFDLVITVGNPIENSEIVVLDNSLLIPNLNDQISYTISYSTTEIIITFNQAVSNGQRYFIKYAKL